MKVNRRFYIKQNDLLPDLEFSFVNRKTGQPQDLTGATLQFHMKDPRTGTVVVNAPAIIDGDPLLGNGRYLWAAGQTATPGTYLGEVQATKNNRPLTAPNRANIQIIIEPELA